VLGDRLSLAVRYVEILLEVAVPRGLLGPAEADRVWERHVLNSAAPAALLPPACCVLDVGSGAGLPGIVLALARPDVRVTLVERMQRRTVFLEECVAALGLGSRVQVRRARAEQLHGTVSADAVTARAVAPLHRLLPLCWPLVRPGGALLAIKGASAATELERDRIALPADACASVVQRDMGGLQEATLIVVRRPV